MEDVEIVRRIDRLVEEEHHLERSHADEPLDEAGQSRLRQVEEHLDQAWDLLRRRRARRAAGGDPDDVGTRATDVVEHYRQ